MRHSGRNQYFTYIAIIMVCLLFSDGIAPKVGVTGIIGSHGENDISTREQDIERIRIFLEKKIVKNKFLEYGIPPELAIEKLDSIGDEDLHILAGKIKQLPEGGDNPNYNQAFELMLIGAVAIIALFLWIIYSIAKTFGNSSPAQVPEESTQ